MSEQSSAAGVPSTPATQIDAMSIQHMVRQESPYVRGKHRAGLRTGDLTGHWSDGLPEGTQADGQSNFETTEAPMPFAGPLPEPPDLLNRPLITVREPRPRSGWRSLAFDLTSGRWNPGPSRDERRIRDREQAIARPLAQRHVTAFFCLKGGIGKTSATAATSLAMADLRADPVFALDANPDAGDLAERLVGSPHAGIAALARNSGRIDSLDDLSQYTVTSGRLTVLPGEPNPELGDSLSGADFEQVLGAVSTYYSLINVDCGTGVTDPVMRGVLAHTDTAIIPASWSITGARRAAETVQWLADHGFEDLASSSIVLLTAKDMVSRQVDREAVRAHLSKAGDVIVVPADRHIADGAQLQWEQLARPTQEAFLDVAAAITRRFVIE